MSVPTGVAQFRLGHRASMTRTEGVRSTTYRSQWHLFPLGASRRPESGAVVLDVFCGDCRLPVRVVLESGPTAAQKQRTRSTFGWLLLAAGIALVVIACLIGGGGAVAGLSGVSGLLAVATSFGVRSAAKSYPGVHVDRKQVATSSAPHRIFVS
ncbi:hypothetical protein ACIRS1_27960 [Kitasatospora sp. NPDC101176]|uniref:hypothetical protein n=1 Tax=Kitasatospora sp. NPDC101176 TaxID=3364099 RepID=UPI0038103675